MNYDYQSIVDEYKQRYTHLMENSGQDTIEYHAYKQILQNIDAIHADTPKQRAFEILITLASLTHSVPEPRVRELTRQCATAFRHDTGLEEWQF